jgi:AcrR family transcriptional regulator
MKATTAKTAKSPGVRADARPGALSARGERARARLKEAALAVLERDGYHKMRIADVTAQAGVAQGLFYHYFKDLKSLTLEVLTDYATASNDPLQIEKNVSRGDWYARIYAHNLVIVRSYAKRPGVMRCLLQMADEDEVFSGFLRENYRNQLMWLVDLMPRLFPQVRFRKHQALMVVYSLAGIGEGLMREYFINESKTLRAAQLSVEQFTELLTTMFYRALFLQHPDEKQLKYTRNLAAMARTH